VWPVSTTNERAEGFGVEGETVVWEGRYSLRNFLGRAVVLGVLLVIWIGLAIWTWGTESAAAYKGLQVITVLVGIGVLIYALVLLRRVVLARYGHFYRLTNRRLLKRKTKVRCSKGKPTQKTWCRDKKIVTHKTGVI